MRVQRETSALLQWNFQEGPLSWRTILVGVEGEVAVPLRSGGGPRVGLEDVLFVLEAGCSGGAVITWQGD